ncbi:putative HLH transcription factor [Talaromyces proteolyticus]|uniref:HLH transcription factor n=1 Tax=Talaromyces proteolyticus TaxID=1131652 RepID=A0AAD4KPD8_9EURO|nr:putative HLH transcription factor [Talaromyces proteolyticus]KAH8692604.1 putative HLH transcription factor [Talaromyces proteolyticus]
MTQSPLVNVGLAPHSSPTEASMDLNALSGDSGDGQEQDWSQWMQWDWEESISNTTSNIGLTPLENSPSSNLMPLPDIDAVDFVSGLRQNVKANLDIAIPHGDRVPRTSPSTKGSSVSSLSNRKRKTSSEDDGLSRVDDDSPPESKAQPSKKRSHNVIEKRYRANLNEKISELRDSIPSLRALSKQGNGDSLTADDDVTIGNKLNKASILSKATEYIRHLELRNRRLEEENKSLKTKLRQLENAMAMDQTTSASVGSASSPDSYSGTIDSYGSPPSVFSHVEDSTTSRKQSESAGPIEGMIKVPDYIKQMRSNAPTQGIFAESYIKDKPKPSQPNENARRGMTTSSKFLLGTMASLMIVQNLPTEKESESSERGLMAVPISLFNEILLPYCKYAQSRFLVWSADVGLWRSWHFRAILSLYLTVVLVVGSAFFVFLYLFNSRPQSDRDQQKVISAAGVRMTPAEFRRQAWLTSMQRVGVPRHTFFLEWFAVTCRWVEYTLGCVLGWKLYSWITGITEEDEKGRIKTWDIAIDAQLAGGDPEISKSRLVLTIFASGTLPRSPGRIMLKALHCRILLWRVANGGSLVSRIANIVGRALATYQWGLAREMHRSLPKDHPEALPRHLAALLENDCNDVLLDTIVQRAVNLTWSQPTQEGLDEDEALLDVVVDDPAVQTSLDSIAAWWSSHILQNALLQSLSAGADGTAVLKTQIDLASRVAPRLCVAHTRALAVRAVLFETNRLRDIQVVLAALPSKKNKNSQATNFLDSSIPTSARDEIAIAVRCAMIAAIIKARTTNDTSFPSHLTTRKAISWLNQLPLDPIELTLVGFVAVYHLLHLVTTYDDILSSSSQTSSDVSTLTTKSAPSSLPNEASSSPKSIHKRVHSNAIAEPTPQYSRIAGDLMYWARNAYNPAFYGLTTKMVDKVEAECISVCNNIGIKLLPPNQSKSVKSGLRKIVKEERKHVKRNSLSAKEENRRECGDGNDTSGWGNDDSTRIDERIIAL